MKKRSIFSLTAVLLCLALILCGCGEASVDEPPATTTTTTTGETTPTPGALSEQDLADIQAFLRDVSNYGFIGPNVYDSTEWISPNYVFYDGAGLDGIPYTNWSQEELQDILETTQWERLYITPRKYVQADVDTLFEQKTGISISDVNMLPQTDFPYSGEVAAFMLNSDYSAYYVIHGDGAYLYEAHVSGGKIDADGLYVINYSDGSTYATQYTVTLRKTEDGYQFVSNKVVSSAAAKAETSKELDETTAAFINGTWKVDKLLCFGTSWNDASEYPTGQDVIGNEIIIRKEQFSSMDLGKYEVYQYNFADPTYEVRDRFENAGYFWTTYKVSIPGVFEDDVITVIGVYNNSRSKLLPGLLYAVNDERLLLGLEAAVFELTRVGD